MALKDQPACFWIGAGLVAEAPLALALWLLPESACDVFPVTLIGCPPPLAALAILGVAIYLPVAWAGYKLGLGQR